MGKLDKYWEWRFNTKKFISDYPELQNILRDKREALAEIAEVRHQNYSSPPGTPGRGDSVPVSAQSAEKLREEIAEYQELLDLHENAYNCLSNEEMTVIRHLYHMPNNRRRTAQWLASEVIHCDRATIYRMAGRARWKIRKYIGV